jgi:hypothetical protein
MDEGLPGEHAAIAIDDIMGERHRAVDVSLLGDGEGAP